MLHFFAWKQVKQNVGIMVKWKEQQEKTSLLDFETLQKTKKSSTSRLQWPGMMSPLKKLLADGPKAGLLAACAISNLSFQAHAL